MATTAFVQRGPAPVALKSDMDMDSFFDFNKAVFSPRTNNIHHQPGPAASSTSQVTNHYIDDEAQFAGPSHEYDRFPQQTGVLGGHVKDLVLNQSMPDNFHSSGGFNSGIDENSFDMNWDTEPSIAINDGMYNNFVDPSYIDVVADEPQSKVGQLWPGMHQQAAMQKAQQLQQQQQPHMSKGKARAQPARSDPDAEQSISRLLDQMRQGSTMSTIAEDDEISQHEFSTGRSKKDEDDMDEDERLLASEEGKKLSSKERRQLRNKVSARAFRSRRKEYIGQLEGEVAQKATEAANLKTANQALTEENERYRALIQTLLRHPSFTPFIEDFSKDPIFQASQQQPSQNKTQKAAPAQPRQKKGQMSDAGADISMLNINQSVFPAGQQSNMTFNFAQPQVSNPQAYQTPLNLGMSAQAQQSRQVSFY